ncbi:MAG: GrdX family protein [Bacillota bacterium]|nr:GrdX family protein [Bacillota bacterium]
MKIITNNKSFLTYKKVPVEYVDGSYLDVFIKVRDYVHKNHKLITHPLYGNIPPTTTFFRTLVIEEGDHLDFQSLELIENSISKVERIIKKDKAKEITEAIEKDLAFIDYTLISETLDNIIL